MKLKKISRKQLFLQDATIESAILRIIKQIFNWNFH